MNSSRNTVQLVSLLRSRIQLLSPLKRGHLIQCHQALHNFIYQWKGGQTILFMSGLQAIK